MAGPGPTRTRELTRLDEEVHRRRRDMLAAMNNRARDDTGPKRLAVFEARRQVALAEQRVRRAERALRQDVSELYGELRPDGDAPEPMLAVTIVWDAVIIVIAVVLALLLLWSVTSC